MKKFKWNLFIDASGARTYIKLYVRYQLDYVVYSARFIKR